MPIERSRQRGASTVLDADTPEALQVSTEEALGHLLRSETYYTRTKKQAAKLAEEASLLPIRLERVRWEGNTAAFAHTHWHSHSLDRGYNRLQTHIKGKLREADHVARKKRIAKVQHTSVQLAATVATHTHSSPPPPSFTGFLRVGWSYAISQVQGRVRCSLAGPTGASEAAA